MLIHSVTPPHLLQDASELPAVSYKQLGGQFIEGVETPQGFRVSRIHSTDPAMYLKNELSPGSFYRGQPLRRG